MRQMSREVMMEEHHVLEQQHRGFVGNSSGAFQATAT